MKLFLSQNIDVFIYYTIVLNERMFHTHRYILYYNNAEKIKEMELNICIII